MMQNVSAIVQHAVFATLEADDLLLTGLNARADENLPQLSFDGMTSQWRDRELRLVIHEVQFSVWGHLAGFADMEALGKRLLIRLQATDIAPLKAVRMQVARLESRLNTSNRLWRQSVRFDILSEGEGDETR